MIDVTWNCSILAAVGDNMVDHPGVAGKFFSCAWNGTSQHSRDRPRLLGKEHLQR